MKATASTPSEPGTHVTDLPAASHDPDRRAGMGFENLSGADHLALRFGESLAFACAANWSWLAAASVGVGLMQAN